MSVRSLYPDEEKILSLHYNGYSRDEIHTMTGISTGKISNIIATEKARLSAADVDAIRRIGREMIKNSKAGGNGEGEGRPSSWLDTANAFAFSNFCKKHNLDIEEIKNALPEILKKCKEQKIRLMDLPLDTESKLKSIAELEEKKNGLQKDIVNLDQEKTQKFKDAHYTDESLAKCRKMTDFLTKNGLSVDAPDRFKNALLNAEKAGYDPRALVEKISSIKSLDIKKINIEESIAKLERDQQENKEIIKGQQLQIIANNDILKAAAELKNMGCNVTVLKAIIDVVRKIVAAANKEMEAAKTSSTTKMMTEEGAMEKFTTDILTIYEPLTGFERAISIKQKEKAELEADIEDLKIEYAKDNDLVDALDVLLKNGVKPDDILAVKYLVEKQGSNLIALKNRIMLCGSLDSLVDKLDKQVKDLDVRKHTLEHDVSLLQTRKESLEKFIQDAADNLQEVVESMIATLSGGEIKTKDMIAGICKDIPSALNVVIAKISDIGKQADDVVKQFAKTRGILVFEALIRAVNGEEVDIRQVRDATVLAMFLLLARLPERSSNRIGLEVLIKNLKGDVSISYFS
jgi:hypothetical protein